MAQAPGHAGTELHSAARLGGNGHEQTVIVAGSSVAPTASSSAVGPRPHHLRMRAAA
ncbi:hypothetical protein Rhow_000555 [Rhodococcus wratislaviensis]|uniref:Uncharacterized protein n=1 Tax=Rhodococcus wratislaviensis TaxID=44752 RepID=A0A402C245_RHOWR|nr:hypothetical protein Rhow_000555 [Rhodococcus wratislaviensis]